MKTLGDIYEKVCVGKVKHETAHAADLEAQRMSRLERVPFKHYHCPCCGKYHTAHQRKNVKDSKDKVRHRR